MIGKHRSLISHPRFTQFLKVVFQLFDFNVAVNPWNETILQMLERILRSKHMLNK